MYAKIVRLFYILTKPASMIYLHNSRRVRVVVRYKNSILLQRSSFGHQTWSLPGGGIEKNETPERAAIRELEEEVGITISEKELTYIGTKRLPSGKRFPMINLVMYEVALKQKIAPTISRPLEILEAEWFVVDELPDNLSETVTSALELGEVQNKT